MNEMIKISENMSAKEQELIKELVALRLKDNKKLEYDPLEDYQVPPSSMFSLANKPMVSIKNREITFNMACVRLFDCTEYVLPLISENRKRLAVVPLKEEEVSSVRWSRTKGGKTVNRTITAEKFVSEILNLMHWSKEYRYKVIGRVVNSPRGMVLVFDLEEALTYTGTSTEVFSEKAGKMVKKQDVLFPSKYDDNIGVPYNEYNDYYQMNLFEDIDNKAEYQSLVT